MIPEIPSKACTSIERHTMYCGESSKLQCSLQQSCKVIVFEVDLPYLLSIQFGIRYLGLVRSRTHFDEGLSWLITNLFLENYAIIGCVLFRWSASFETYFTISSACQLHLKINMMVNITIRYICSYSQTERSCLQPERIYESEHQFL